MSAFKAAYDEALDKLTDARLSPYPLAIGKMILKGSLLAGRLKLVVPDLEYFMDGTGIHRPHVCDAIKELTLRNIIFVDPPGDNRKGTKLYWINCLFNSWRLKQHKIKRQANLPLVLDQLTLEYDKWVTARGPLSDSLLENFVETAGGAVETLTNLCGGQKPPAVTERPVGGGNLADGKTKPALVNPGARSDGSQSMPAAVATQSLAATIPSDGHTLARRRALAQGRKSTPLEKSANAWTWVVIVDNSGPVQKLTDPLCRWQWEELCMTDPDYVLGWLVGCWRHRCRRGDRITNPLSYLSMVALGDHKLTKLKVLAESRRMPPPGGGAVLITESVITSFRGV